MRHRKTDKLTREWQKIRRTTAAQALFTVFLLLMAIALASYEPHQDPTPYHSDTWNRTFDRYDFNDGTLLCEQEPMGRTDFLNSTRPATIHYDCEWIVEATRGGE